MQISKQDKTRLVGKAEPMSAEQLQETAAIRVNVAGIKDGDVVEFPSDVEVYPYVVNGNTTPIVLAKVNKTPARFFLSNFMNQGYPIVARGSESEISALPAIDENATPEFIKDSNGRNVVLANEGPVMDDWKKAKSLGDAVKLLANKKIKFTTIEWIQTMFQKRARFNIEWI